MRKVGHNGHVPSTVDDSLEKPQGIVGVWVGNEAIRPVRHCLGAEADSRDVVQGGILQDWVYVCRKLGGVHHHRVASGEENVADVSGKRGMEVDGQKREARGELIVVVSK